MAQNINLLSVRLHSTKLLCGILLSGVINIANATTSTQEIPIVVTVNPVCVLNLNITNLKFDLVVGVDNSATTTLTVTCTPQSTVAISVTSVNSWNLVGINHHKEIPYIVSYLGGGYTAGANVNPTWSGQVAGTEVVTGTAQNTPWQIPLNFSFPNIMKTHVVDEYSDTITFEANY